jgi:hypothetical protein
MKLTALPLLLLLAGCVTLPGKDLNTCKAFAAVLISGKCTLSDYIAARTAELTTAATVMRDLHAAGGKGVTGTGQTTVSQGAQVVKPMVLSSVLVEIPASAVETKSPATASVLQKIGALATQTGGTLDLSPADDWTRKQLLDGANSVAPLASLSLVIKDTGAKSVSPKSIVVRLRREIPPTITLQQ